MSSLIIKVTINGSSREFIFEGPGPHVLGSSGDCDLVIDDTGIPGKLMELKVSGGNIFIKDLGKSEHLTLNSAIMPSRQEVRYREGDLVTLLSSGHQFCITSARGRTEPPPFFEEEMKPQFEAITKKLKAREADVQKITVELDKKKGHLIDLEKKGEKMAKDKGKLEIDVLSLQSQKERLGHELRKHENDRKAEEDKLRVLKEQVRSLEGEERQLLDSINQHHQSIIRLKSEMEQKGKELEHQRITLAQLALDCSLSEGKLEELKNSQENQKSEIANEEAKLKNLLLASEKALKEKSALEVQILASLQNKETLESQIREHETQLEELEKKRTGYQNSLTEYRCRIEEEEATLARLARESLQKRDEEEHLKNLNAELRSELLKAEERLAVKKDQLNHLEHQEQEVKRRISTMTFEMDQVETRLSSLMSEEKAQELKMISLRDEIGQLAKKGLEERKLQDHTFRSQKDALEKDLGAVKSEILESHDLVRKLTLQESAIKEEIKKLADKKSDLLMEKKSITDEVSALDGQRTHLQANLRTMREDVSRLEQEKNLFHREISILTIKKQDLEGHIREREVEANLALENYKREERAKIIAEREVFLSEVETFKQKSLAEVEVEYRQKLEELAQQKFAVGHEVESILKAARVQEIELTKEASRRLQEATLESERREKESHKRVHESQEFLRMKEEEGKAIIEKAQMVAQEEISELKREASRAMDLEKASFKTYLNKKRERSLESMKNLQDQHALRLKKDEERNLMRLEDIKRRELKKIAKHKEEELEAHRLLRETLLKEANAERDQLEQQVQELKSQQERELQNTKKTVLEHINQTKVRQQEAWEQELAREKKNFEQTKRERVVNATNAVMNVFIAENEVTPESQDKIRGKIQHSLEMAINGQNANAYKEVEQILDFNPMKRKKAMAVMQKYAIRAGIPAALALIMTFDLGSVRSHLVSYSKDLIKQKESAADKFVKDQKIAWTEKNTYTPTTTPGYKATFADNILYTTDFEKIMESEPYQNDWILKVHDFIVKELELSEEVAISYISSEGTLLKEMSQARKELNPQYLDVGLKKLKDLEETHLGWLKQKITDPMKEEKFLAFRKDYFDARYNESKSPLRNVATEKKP